MIAKDVAKDEITKMANKDPIELLNCKIANIFTEVLNQNRINVMT